MASIAYPYFRIDPARVIAAPWTWLDQPDLVVPEQIEHWDHTTDLRLVRRVALDFPAVAAGLGHDADSLRLELVVTVGTGSTRGDRRRHIWRRTELTKASPAFTVELELSGEDLSQAVTLRTDILMLGPETAASALAPREAGLKLWGDLQFVRLEPLQPRFPIETVSFREEFPDTPDAPWRLSWLPGDLTRDFSGSVQLYLNRDQPEFVERVSMPDRPVLDAMMHQVMSQIVRVVLADDDIAAFDLEEAPTSVAAAAFGWLGRTFPGLDAVAMRQLLRSDPAGFEARLGQFAAGGANA